MTTVSDEEQKSDSAAPTRPLRDRQLWLVLLLAALVLLPRSYLITRSQSERADDEYHIARGLFFLQDPRLLKPIRINDPPLGQAIGIIPLWLAGNWPAQPFRTPSFIYGPGNKFSGEAVLNIIGLWKSMLFIPVIGLIFIWVRRLYGVRSGWLAVALVLIEPTLAAHLPLPTPDVLGVEALLFASYFSWRYFESPSLLRQVISCFSMGAALLIKHTCIILPGVGGVFAIWWWVLRPWMRGELAASWRGQVWKRIGISALGVFLVLFSMWVLLKFDTSRPVLPKQGTVDFKTAYPIVGKILDRPLPGGLYITSFLYAQEYAARGRWGYLFGDVRREGWWYYFPVVATYKVPIGIGAILLAGLISLKWKRPRWEEWSLFIPMALVGGFMIVSKFNLGWRHFLPAYVFAMLMASRAVISLTRNWTVAIWALVAFAFVDALRYHPDYIPYTTIGRSNAYLAISDSNVDWGEGLKYVQQWVKRNPRRRAIYVRSFLWLPDNRALRARLDSRVTILGRPPRLPTAGVLIISPVSLVGLYESRFYERDPFRDPYKPLRERKPDAILGNVMHVYDLDRMKREGNPIQWGPQPRLRPPGPRRPPRTTTRRRSPGHRAGGLTFPTSICRLSFSRTNQGGSFMSETALNSEQIRSALAKLSGWQQAGNEIVKTYSFKNYHETMAFVNASAWISHQTDHHPDLEVGYNKCKVRYSTHSAGGITQKDIDCAARIDGLFGS